MLFYTWPFNPRPPLFKGGLCLPLPKIPKRLPARNNPFEALRPPHKSIARKRAQAVKYRKNFVKVALRHQRGSFPLSRLRRPLKLRAPLLAELSAKAAFIQAPQKRSDAKTAVRHGGKNYAQPCKRHTRTESAQTRPPLNTASKRAIGPPQKCARRKRTDDRRPSRKNFAQRPFQDKKNTAARFKRVTAIF